MSEFILDIHTHPVLFASSSGLFLLCVCIVQETEMSHKVLAYMGLLPSAGRQWNSGEDTLQKSGGKAPQPGVAGDRSPLSQYSFIFKLIYLPFPSPPLHLLFSFIGSHVVWAGLKLTMWLSITLNF